MNNLPFNTDCKPLICAIGGGFDIFGSLPLLGSFNDFVLSSYSLNKSIGIMNWKQKYAMESFDYFPEKILLDHIELPLYVVGKFGPAQLKKYYKELIEKHNIDMVITVDCGVDSLMSGDEEHKGTIAEEYANFAGIMDIDIPKVHVCFGFGCEAEERISHYRVLENISKLIRHAGFLGSFSLTKQDKEYQFYRNAYNTITKYPEHKRSHIHPRIISAIEGHFGTHTETEKTLMSSGKDCFISPLMGMYWFFDGDVIIKNIPKLKQIKQATSFIQVASWVNGLEATRENKVIPL